MNGCIDAINDEAPAFARASLFRLRRSSGLLHVHRVEAFWTLLHFERDLVTFVERRPGPGLVHEDVFSTLIRGDETKTFLRVEELHCTA